MRITRRKFLVGLAAAAALGALGYYFYTATSPRKRVLRVYNYSAYINPEVIEEFKERYSVEVVYDEYESAEEAFAKLKLGGGGYDVIVLTDQYVTQAIKQGLLRPLDKSLIPNLANVDSFFIENYFDPGLNYSVPYSWGTTGIGYNAKYVEESEIEGYEQLFDTEGFLPRHKGKVSMLEEFLEVVNAAKLYLGIPLDDWSEEAANKVVELLRRQKEFLAGYYGASVYIPGLVQGTLHAAHAWSGDVMQAQSEEENVKYVLPKEGVFVWIDFMVIPRGSREVELAHLWINFLLEREVAAKNTGYTYYPSPLRKDLVKDLLSSEILENPAVYPPPGAKLVMTKPLTEEALQVLERMHTAVKKV
uniref:Spermidine/putrescine ABC transporter substrate-binding protein n=3 Tax=Thermofilum pendens TaxID=2269 RepID=A0A7J3X6C0_THEPE